MRIAVATHTLTHVGGVEVYVERSVQALQAAGHELCVFAEAAAAGPRVAPDVPAWTPRGGKARSMLAAVRAFAPDVLVAHGLHDPVTETALADLHPAVFFAHAYHGTCVSGAKAFSLPTIQACSRTLGPGCLARYYPRRCGGLDPLTMLRQYQVQSRRLAAVRRHDAVFTFSRHIAREYERHGVPPGRIRLLPPPVPAPAPMPPGDRGDPEHVVYIGRLERLKGPSVAVAAAAEAAVRLGRSLRMTIAGSGSGTAAVQRAVARVSRRAVDVRLVGQLQPDEVQCLLARAGVLLVPSLWPEPFGLVGLEAAAHGVPVVAFRVGGIPEWLADGVSGHLADASADPVAALSGAIVRALVDERHHADLRAGALETHAAAAARDHTTALIAALSDLVRLRRGA